MMNHGLALYKPGESHLGTAIRLWIVNRHSWTRGSSSIDDRIRGDIVILDSLYAPLNIGHSHSLHSLKCAHAKLLGYDLPVKMPRWPVALNRRYRKQCLSCAKLGHHSILFDLPWVRNCPIHEEPLSKQCPMCNKSWPSISELSTRSCDLCGAQLSLEGLLDEDAFNTDVYSKKIPELLAFFCNNIQMYQPSRSYFASFPAAREDSVSLVNALPSLLSCYSKNRSIRHTLERSGVEISRCHKKTFIPVLINDIKNLKPDIELMNRCRKRIFNLSLRVLLRIANHKIGSCPRDALYSHFTCPDCEAWRTIKEGFRKTLSTRDDRILIRYSPPYTRVISVPDPGLVTSIYNAETASHYKVPRNIQAIIYCTDLWQCVFRMFSQIEYFLSAGPASGAARPHLLRPQANYLDHCKHHFTPYYFVKRDEDCQLVFPIEFSSKQLHGSRAQLERFTEVIDA